jgi:hypothetical protein
MVKAEFETVAVAGLLVQDLTPRRKVAKPRKLRKGVLGWLVDVGEEAIFVTF